METTILVLLVETTVVITVVAVVPVKRVTVIEFDGVRDVCEVFGIPEAAVNVPPDGRGPAEAVVLREGYGVVEGADEMV